MTSKKRVYTKRDYPQMGLNSLMLAVINNRTTKAFHRHINKINDETADFSINSTDKNGNSVLHYVASNNTCPASILKLILENGADVNIYNKWNCNPLTSSIRKMIRETIRSDDDNNKLSLILTKMNLLLEAGSNISTPDDEGITIIMALCDTKLGAITETRRIDEKRIILRNIFEIVMDNGGNKNINAQDRNGLTALHYATKYPNPFATDILLKNNIGIDIQDNEGNTALNLLLINKENFHLPNSHNIDMVKLLLDYGADVSIENNKKETPYSVFLSFGKRYSRNKEWQELTELMQVKNEEVKLTKLSSNIENNGFSM